MENENEARHYILSRKIFILRPQGLQVSPSPLPTSLLTLGGWPYSSAGGPGSLPPSSRGRHPSDSSAGFAGSQMTFKVRSHEIIQQYRQLQIYCIAPYHCTAECVAGQGVALSPGSPYVRRRGDWGQGSEGNLGTRVGGERGDEGWRGAWGRGLEGSLGMRLVWEWVHIS